MKKVLIVEDDLTIARIYQGLIRMEGCHVEIATDGEAAVQQIDQGRPDLVLLDLMLPKKNGVEVLRHIRSKAAFSETPVIVFTNAYLGSLVGEAWGAGATQCLIKAQTTPKQLMEVVRGYLRGTATPPASNTQPAPAPVSVPSPPSAPAEAGRSELHDEPDTTFQAEMRAALLRRAPGLLGALRRELQTLAKCELGSDKQARLLELCRLLHSLTGNAGLVGLNVIAQMSSALEALAKELHGKLSKLNPSSVRTFAQGVDCLDHLVRQAGLGESSVSKPPLVLVLDDDAVSRRVTCASLERAGLRTLKLEDPNVALRIMQENAFDLIFLDVNMPGMDGFEVCKKVRACAGHHSTPVVFVTALTDLESRAQSIMSGGNDFIGKPFLFMELTVKALVYVLRARPGSPEPAEMRGTAAESNG